MEWKNLLHVLNQYGTELEILYREKAPKASHRLANFAKYQININGSNIEVGLNLEEYYKYVENGRKPNSKFPPLDKIRNWIKIKPVIPYADSNGRIPTESQLTYLIARKIAIEGIEPKPIFKQSVEEVNNKYFELIKSAIVQDIKNEYSVIATELFKQ